MLSDLIICGPGTPRDVRQWATAWELTGWAATYFSFSLVVVQGLISKCCKRNLGYRHIPNEIGERLEVMTFKLTHNVNSSTLSEIVTTINE
jgi:hypothetical protein